MGDVDAASASAAAPSVPATTAAPAAAVPAKEDAEKQKTTGGNEAAKDGSAGLLESDIETVMREANVDREKAVALLKEHGDTVEAILAAEE